jgi:hypothetical protein
MSPSKASLLANNICTPFFPYPHLMDLFRINVPSCARAYCFFCRVGVVGVCVCYRAVEDEMGGLAAVLVGGVMRIAGTRQFTRCA